MALGLSSRYSLTYHSINPEWWDTLNTPPPLRAYGKKGEYINPRIYKCLELPIQAFEDKKRLKVLGTKQLQIVQIHCPTSKPFHFSNLS